GESNLAGRMDGRGPTKSACWFNPCPTALPSSTMNWRSQEGGLTLKSVTFTGEMSTCKQKNLQMCLLEGGRKAEPQPGEPRQSDYGRVVRFLPVDTAWPHSRVRWGFRRPSPART